jgi:hypothetical protein
MPNWKTKEKYFVQKMNKERQAGCGLWFKSNLNDKEHFYCRPNVGEIAEQYGT